jgi:hypothetical protein
MNHPIAFFGRRLPVWIVIIVFFPALAWAQDAKVSIGRTNDGGYTLLRNGKPFFIKGGGGDSHLDTLVACGGNSIRTWGIESLEKDVNGKRLVDRAQELGIAITAGIWVEHERHGFNYDDPAQIQKQRDAVRQAVRKYKDCPAILMWGLGNEMEGPTSNGSDPRTQKIWQELNVLASIIKEEDKNHPVMTVIASAAPAKVQGIVENYPNIDVLGVNAYAGGGGVGQALKQAGWKKPFVLTEFGPPGQWEVPKTPWGAPVEPSSWEKAGGYYATEEMLLESSKDIFLGSYAFLWGFKQEATSTWYGMFLETGEKLPSVDAMTHLWTGAWPANRSPKISAFTTPLKESTVAPGQIVAASIDATDAEKDPLTYEWKVVAESTDHQEGGDAEKVPPTIRDCVINSNGPQATIKTPLQPGAYRLFVTVRDGKGGASEDNVPFLVTR